MTIRELLDYTMMVKPSAFSESTMLLWLNELEGRVQLDIYLMAPSEVKGYSLPEDESTELLIGLPHTGVYRYWMEAMVDLENGEYKKYQNTMEVFNNAWNEYACWFAETQGTEGDGVKYGFYLSAYGIAVKHGYDGTEEEWLLSLVGPRGPAGPEGPVGPKGQDGTVAFEELTEAQVEMLRGPAGKDGEPGKNGEPGEDGVSPTVSVTAIAGGHRVSITDANGTKTFDVMDGEDGEGGGGGSGENGATFYPYVDSEGNLSWTNDGGLSNPETVNIKGPAGKDGATGPAGADGQPGKDGEPGPAGANGKDATINGVTVLTIEVDENLTITQSGSVLKIGLGKVPETSNSTVVSLTTGGWSQQSNGEYAQTVTVPFMTAAAKVVTVDVDKPGTDLDADAAAMEGFAVISGATDPVQMDGAMKFYAYEVPTVNVPVKVGVS